MMSDADTSPNASPPANVAAPEAAPAASASPAPNIAHKAAKEIAKAKTGFDPLKPFRYSAIFIGGALQNGLNDMAHYGRNGMWVGMAMGAIAAIALSSLVMPLVIGTLGGFALGALGGGSFGAITGGFKAVGRTYRGEKYAEDLVKREKVRGLAPSQGLDNRAAKNDKRQRDAFVTQQVLERDNERTRDFGTYWQDMVSGGEHSNQGRGF